MYEYHIFGKNSTEITRIQKYLYGYMYVHIYTYVS